jgi:hypothetical protein
MTTRTTTKTKEDEDEDEDEGECERECEGEGERCGAHARGGEFAAAGEYRRSTVVRGYPGYQRPTEQTKTEINLEWLSNKTLADFDGKFLLLKGERDNHSMSELLLALVQNNIQYE